MTRSTPQLESLRGLLVASLVWAAACSSGDGAPGGESAFPESGARASASVTPGNAAAITPVLESQVSGVEVLLQAVSPVSERIAWISGHGGTWIRTEDGGARWVSGVVQGHDALQFRDVHAFDAYTAVLMSAGEGPLSRIFRTEDAGESWAEVFVMDHAEGFLDCMDFWSDGRGLAYGDAVDGELYLLHTDDGGRSWSRVPTEGLPPALQGEGGFAASGTCLRTGAAGRAWVSTGNGSRPRFLSTADYGRMWSVTDLPLAAGEASGATTVGMRPDGMGFALGGSLAPEGPGPRVALSADDGITWSTVGDLVMEGAADGAAWVPDRDPATLLAVGPGGMDWSADGGMRWNRLDTLSYWAVEFASSSVGWAAGPDGRVTRVDLR